MFVVPGRYLLSRFFGMSRSFLGCNFSAGGVLILVLRELFQHRGDCPSMELCPWSYPRGRSCPWLQGMVVVGGGTGRVAFRGLSSREPSDHGGSVEGKVVFGMPCRVR